MRHLALLFAACGALGCGDVFFRGLRLTIEDHQLVAQQRIDRDHFDYTYRARCVLQGPKADAVVAVLESTSPSTQVVDGTLRCGPIATLSSAPSLDTFTIRQDRNVPFDPGALRWIVGAIGPLEAAEEEVEEGGVPLTRSRYRVAVSNGGTRSQTLIALLSSARSTVSVVDDRALLSVRAGEGTASADTVDVVRPRGIPLDAAALSLTLQLAPAGTGAAAIVATLDGVGHPLGGVAIDEMRAGAMARLASDGETGFATLGQGGGELAWKFSRDGYVPVWRTLRVDPGKIAVIPSPRLAEREPATPLPALEDGVAASADGSVRVAFAAGAFPGGADARLTRLDGQSLPLLLPAGWSPLAAFWLEVGEAPATAGRATVTLDQALAAGDRAALVTLDEAALAWRVLRTLSGASETVTEDLTGAGSFAVVVADEGEGAPATPVPGGPLPAGSLVAPAASGLFAEGRVAPSVRAASPVAQEVTGDATLALVSDAPIPSGLLLQLSIDERYVLQDDRTLTLPGVTSFLVAYRRPGSSDPTRASARFPLRPRELFAGDVLSEALLHARISAVAEFSGGVLAAGGGTLSAPGVEVLAAPGDLADTRPARLDALDAASFASLLPGDAAPVVAFELGVDGVVTGRALRASFAPQEPNAAFVLARAVSGGGLEGLEPVERLSSDATGILAGTEPAAGERLPGIVRGGRYVLVRVAARPGLVVASARSGAGGSTPLGVTLEGQPWLSIGASGGVFRLVAPSGAVSGVARELASGDEGRADGALADAAAVLALELVTGPTGPRVVAVEPEDGSRGIGTVTPVRVRFSEPLVAGSFGPDGLVLRDADGARIEGALTLDLARTSATLLPSNPLASRTDHTIELAGAIRDAQGLALEGERSFSFTTASPAARGAGAQLVVYEPGADTAACDDVPGVDRSAPTVVCATGSQGTADPDVAVVLVNESTGVTSTVRSREDGSFEGFVDAAEDELVSATFVNTNGTRVQVPVSKQIFDDGSVGLFSLGGTVEVELPTGTAEVVVEPGAIAGKTKLRLRAIPPEIQQQVIGDTPPEIGTLLGQGLVLEASGDPLRVPPDVRIAVDEATLVAQGFDPSKPEEATFALVQPREIDGVVGYQVLDKLEYEDGKLVSHSPPFPGPNPNAPPGPADPTASCGVPGAAALLDDLNRSLELVLQLLDPSGLSFIVEKIMFWPLTMAIRARPAVFTGDVLELFPGQVTCSSVARPLPGALVTVRAVTGPGQLSPPRAGRLDPGQSFALSDPTGKYSLLLPRADEDLPHAVTAQHPRHIGLRVVEPANEFVFPNPFSFLLSPNDIPNPNSVTDLIFPAPLGNTTETPPQVAIANVPLLPAPGATASVSVFSAHGLATPTVGLACKDVRPLGSSTTGGSCADVTIGGPADAPIGATGIRRVFPVTVAKPVLVILEASASVPGSNPTRVEYGVAFGGEAPPPAGGLPVSDPNDEVPPIAVNTWPADGAVGFTPGLAIEVNFSEPVKRSLLAPGGGVTLSGPGLGAGSTPDLDLSPDQIRLTVQAGTLAPDETYTLTLTSAIQDLAGNHFDGDPSTDAAESLSIQFRTSPIVRGSLNLELGASAVTQGIYTFALDRRGTTDGALVVFDLSSPASPVEVARFNLPAFPRDLALIPEYSVVRKPGEPAQKKTLVAIVGGLVGGSTSNQGEFTGGGQFLIVVDVSDPTTPIRFGSSLLTLGPDKLLPRILWSPPFLGYVETSGDLQAVGVLNLQTFLLGTNATPQEFAQFPISGTPGKDENGDGDFTDPGESLPLPCRCPGEIAGRVLGFTLGNTTQKINDLEIDAASGYFAVAVSSGRLRDTAGQPTGAFLPPRYRTLFKNGELPVPRADFIFPDAADPKRVRFFAGLPILVNDVPTPTDVALVSVNEGGVGRVVVLDVTDPLAVKELNAIDIPAVHGLVQSIGLREDGLLFLATSEDLLLFDPAQLAVPQPAGATHPGIVAAIPGAGSGQRTVMSLAAGLSVVNLGSKSEVVQTAPLLSFVRAPGIAPFDPGALAGNQTLREQVLDALEISPAVFPSRVVAEAGVPSDLQPPSPNTHYYVRIDAPGSAGSQFPIALESLDLGGRPLRNLGLLYAPVRAMDSSTESQIGGDPLLPCDPVSTPLLAKRLSSLPADPDYNVYLAGPFVLVIEELSKSALDAARNVTPKRVVLWSGFTLRATIDASISSASPLRPFASKPDFAREELKPGVGAFAFTFPGEYLLGPNPEPVVGGIQAPASQGAVQGHNGEMRLSDVDFQLPGRRIPIAWTRTYGAQDLFKGPLGRGWDFYYNQRVRELAPSTFGFGSQPLVDRGDPAKDDVARGSDVVFYDGEGGAVLFRSAGETPPSPAVTTDPLVAALGWLDPSKVRTYYLPQRGVFDLLFKFEDGRFARLTPQGDQFWYEPDGRLATIYDAFDENAIKLRYNRAGQLTRILDELDRSIEIGWNRKATDPLLGPLDVVATNRRHVGQIARIRDYSGREIEYRYDEKGNLSRRVGPNITQSALGGFTGPDEVEYLYSSCAEPLKTANSLTGTIDPGAGGAPILQTLQHDGVARDRNQRVSSLGGAVGSSFSAANEAADLPGATARFVGPDQLPVEYRFNEFAQPERMTIGVGTSARAYDYRYTTDGLLEGVTNPLGDGVTFVYPPPNAPLRSRANVVETRRIPRSGSGEPTLTARSPHDPRYNLPAGQQQDYAGRPYEIILEPEGRDVEAIEYANGDIDSFARNTFGQVERQTSADGVIQDLTHNADGFVETVRAQGLPAQLRGYGGAAGRRGLASSITDPRGTAVALTWNERDQLVRREKLSAKEEWGFDAAAREFASSRTAEAGQQVVQRRHFDASGFVDRLEIEGVEVATGPQTLTYRLFPDAAKRLQRIEYPDGTQKQHFYDGLGQLERVVIGEREERFGYDRNGLLTSQTVGTATEGFLLDGHGRVEEVRHPVGGKTIFAYDGNDNVTSMRVEDPDFGLLEHREIEYDARNRESLSRVVLDLPGAPLETRFDHTQSSQRKFTVQEPTGATSRYEWTAAGQLVQVDDDFSLRQIVPDANGNVTEVHSVESGRIYSNFTSYDRLDHQDVDSDLLGLLGTTRVRPDGGVKETIDAMGRSVVTGLSILAEPLHISKPNGVTHERHYDALRRLETIIDPSGNTTTNRYDTSMRTLGSDMPGGISVALSSFDAQDHAQRAILSGTIDVEHILDPRGRPEQTEYAGFAGLPLRRERFAYDVLDRPRLIEAPNGKIEVDYDRLGIETEIRTTIDATTYTVGQLPDAVGDRTELAYPALKVKEERDLAGRLIALRPVAATAVASDTTFVGSELQGGRKLGGGVIRLEADFDERRRPLFRRYVNASGETLLDLRYSFDAVDDLLARQRLDRGGRADVYRYDEGHRLLRADAGARPALSGETARAFQGFTAPATATAGWSPGLYARALTYDDRDVIVDAAEIKPDPARSPPFADTYGATDSTLHVGAIDGQARLRDALGNTGKTPLWVRDDESPDAVRASATLVHDQKSSLARVERDDGVVIENQYDGMGLRNRRTITCPPQAPRCRPSDRTYLYHDGLLLEEYEGPGTPQLRARYYYGDDAEVLGMDLRRGTGVLERFYFLTDVDGSVLAVADAAGAIVERVLYDAWGEPSFESLDRDAPRLRRVVAGTAGTLLLEFSERVLPPIVLDANNPGLQERFALLQTGISGTSAGTPVLAQVRYADAEPGFALGTVVRFEPAQPPSGTITLRLAQGTLRDEWGNALPETVLTLDAGVAPGTTLFTAPGAASTAPVARGRSQLDLPLLFHGEYYDYEAGLVYLRTRFYQPATGLFLERDPKLYADGVNAYAGLANNPVGFRDPTGEISVLSLLKAGGRSVASGVARTAKLGVRGFKSVARRGAAAGGWLGRKSSALRKRLTAGGREAVSNTQAAQGGTYATSAAKQLDAPHPASTPDPPAPAPPRNRPQPSRFENLNTPEALNRAKLDPVFQRSTPYSATDPLLYSEREATELFFALTASDAGFANLLRRINRMTVDDLASVTGDVLARGGRTVSAKDTATRSWLRSIGREIHPDDPIRNLRHVEDATRGHEFFIDSRELIRPLLRRNPSSGALSRLKREYRHAIVAKKLMDTIGGRDFNRANVQSAIPHLNKYLDELAGTLR